MIETPTEAEPMIAARKTRVVFNPRAGSFAAADAVRDRLHLRRHVAIVETTGPGDVPVSVAEAVAAGAEVIVAAGGDGTAHAVLNALAPRFDRVCLGVLPLGTGNDLCRTLGMPEDPVTALAALDAGREHRLDVLAIDTPTERTYSLNLASGGFSGQLREALTADVKATWGPLAYLRGAAGVVTDLTGYRCRFTFDGGEVLEVEALNVIVANGRFAARGWAVASRADPEDGLLDVVIVRYGEWLDLASVAAALLAGTYEDDERVIHRRARSVRIESDPPMPWSVDGEPADGSPVTFTVLPGAARVLVGAEYRAEPE